MPPLAAIERFFERLFERPSARLFRARLQPVQLQRRIERAMEAERLAATDRTLVPNRFVVHLHPDRPGRVRRHDRHRSPPSSPTARWCSPEPTTTRSSTGRGSTSSPIRRSSGPTSRVEARFADADRRPRRPGAGARTDPADSVVDETMHTRVFTGPAPGRAARPASRHRPGWPGPARSPIEAAGLTIGRAADNDLVAGRRPRVAPPRPDHRPAGHARLLGPRQHERVAGQRRRR